MIEITLVTIDHYYLVNDQKNLVANWIVTTGGDKKNFDHHGGQWIQMETIIFWLPSRVDVQVMTKFFGGHLTTMYCLWMLVVKCDQMFFSC